MVLKSVLPRVVIDARMVGPIPHGIGKYVTHLARSFLEHPPEKYEPVFLVQPGRGQYLPWKNLKTVETDIAFLSVKELMALPKLLKEIGASLYHSPSFSSLPWAPCPWVVTVHDLNHLTYGSASKKLYYKTLLRSFCKRAAKVLTVSEFSRQEISDWLSVSGNDVEIVPNAIEGIKREKRNMEFELKLLEEYGLKTEEYYLAFAGAKKHKNIQFLADVYSKIAEKTHWPLVITSDPFLKNPHANILQIGGVNEVEGNALLINAGAMVFPSTYEGFGLPPVEAAALGVPVLASSIPPHVESYEKVAMDSGVELLPPTDSDAWAKAMLELSQCVTPGSSPEVQKRILSEFSVDRLGKKMDQIYRGVLQV